MIRYPVPRTNYLCRAISLEALSAQKSYLLKMFARPTQLIKDVGQVAEEVLQHLSSINGEIEVTLEIQVKTPDGVPGGVARTITENCRRLKFTNYEFEEE